MLKPQTGKHADRVEIMFDSGLLNEAKHLSQILTPNHWALQVMGYREALSYLDGQITLKAAKELTLIRHRQYAKRQYTWFKAENFYVHL